MSANNINIICVHCTNEYDWDSFFITSVAKTNEKEELYFIVCTYVQHHGPEPSKEAWIHKESKEFKAWKNIKQSGLWI